jgi:hypothetical protein
MAQDDDWFVDDGAEDDAPTVATPPPGVLSSRPPPVTIPTAPAVPWEGGGATQPHAGIGGGAPVPQDAFDDGPTAIHVPSAPAQQQRKSVPGARRVRLPSEPSGPHVDTGEHARRTPSASGEAPFTPPPGPAANLKLGDLLEVTELPASPSGQMAATPGAQPLPPTMTPPGGVPAPSFPSAPPQAPPPSTPPTPQAQHTPQAEGFNPFGEATFSSFNHQQDAPLSEAGAPPPHVADDAGPGLPPVPQPGAMVAQSVSAQPADPTVGAMTYVGVPSVDSGVSIGMIGALFALVVAAVRAAGTVVQSFTTGKHVGMPWGSEAWLQAGAADAGRSLLSGGGAQLVDSTLAAQGYQPSPPLAWLEAGAQAIFGPQPWAPYAALGVPLAFGLWYLFRAAAPHSLAVRAALVVVVASLPITRTMLTTLAPEAWAGVFLGASVLWLLGARGPRSRTACFGLGALAGLALATDPGHAYLVLLVTVIALAASVAVGRLRASRISGEIVQHAALWVLGWAVVGLPVFIASREWASEGFKQGVARAGDASAGANLKALFGIIWEQGGVAFLALALPLTLVAVAAERRGGSLVALLRQVAVAFALLVGGLFAGATDETGGPAGWLFVTAALVTLAAGAVGGLGRLHQLLGGRGPAVAGALAALLVVGTLFTGPPLNPLDAREQRALRGHQGLVDRAYDAVRRQVLSRPRLQKRQGVNVLLTPIKMKAGWWGSALPYFKARAARDGLGIRFFDADEKDVFEQLKKADLLLGWAPQKFVQEGPAGLARAAADRAQASPWFEEAFAEPRQAQGFKVVVFARLDKPKAAPPPPAQAPQDPDTADEQPNAQPPAKGTAAPSGPPAGSKGKRNKGKDRRRRR